MSDIIICLVGSADIWAGSPMFLESLNLYVEIKLEGSAVQCTNVIEQNKAPAWNEEFRLYVSSHHVG
jgi:Ca2+-dependent lipid-binding protein